MLKLRKVFSYMVVAFLVAASFVGCVNYADDEYTVIVKDPTTYYTISYSTDYGFAPVSVKVEEGSVLTSSLLPTLSNVTSANVQREFLGWYDADTDSYVNSGITKITKDLNLKATWKTSLITDADKSVFYGTSWYFTFTGEDGNTYDGILDIESENSIKFTSTKYYRVCDKAQWGQRTTTDNGWTVYGLDSSDTTSSTGNPLFMLDLGINPLIKIFKANVVTYAYADQDEETEKASLAAMSSAFTAFTKTSNQEFETKEWVSLTYAPAMLSCYVSAVGGQQFGHAVLKDVSFKNDNGTIYCTLKTGTGVGVIFNIPFIAYIEPSIKSISDDTYSTPKYYSASNTLTDAEYTVSSTEFGISNNLQDTGDKVLKTYAVDSIKFPVSKDKSEYNLWIYINSNVMGVQFCDGSGDSSSQHPNEATPYAATLTVDWDRVVFE